MELSEATNAVTVLTPSIDETPGKRIHVDVGINDLSLRFIVDTGSSVSLLNDKIFWKHLAGCSLTIANIRLLDYSRKQIQVRGCFLAEIVNKQTRTCVLCGKMQNIAFGT